MKRRAFLQLLGGASISVARGDRIAVAQTNPAPAYNRRTVRLSQFGALPNDTVSQHAGIMAALAQIQEMGGGAIEIDNQGVYAIGSSILLENASVPIVIENKAGGILKASTSLATPVMKLGLLTDGTVSTAKLIAYNLFIDNSQAQYSVGESSGEGLSVRWFDHVELHGYRCEGGFDPNDTETPTSGGDAGFSSVGCRSVIMNDPVISGQPDAALYPNWDNTGTIDGYFEVNGGIFFNNNFCMTAKRNLAKAIIRGAYAHDNLGGFTVQEINAPTKVDVCRYMEIDGVLIERTLANVALWRDKAKGGIRNCHIKDIGYKPDGTGGVGANAIAVYALGASGIFSHNNIFEMVDWAQQGEYAYRQDNSSFDSISYTGGALDLKRDTYRNWSRHTLVTNIGTPGKEVDAVFDGLGSQNRFNSNFAKQGDEVSYFDKADGRHKVFVGGSDYACSPGGSFKRPRNQGGLSGAPSACAQ